MDIARKVEGFWSEVAEIPQIKRGMVWCHSCGREQRVDGGACLRRGWPVCCGETMSIDSPEERASRRSE